jgi:transcription initiation factor TFIIIB Brf1 subunit/transcription initiation factor TFIIB
MSNINDDFEVFETIDVQLANPTTITITTCKHEHTQTDCGRTECIDCGEEIKAVIDAESKMFASTDGRSMGDGNRCWAPKKKMKGIREDVKGLGFPEPIINVAEDIFKTVTAGNIFRVDKRKAIIVACLMEAYKIEKQEISLEFILKRISVSNITVGTKIVETQIKKYDTKRSRSTYTSPEDSIKDILSQWDSDITVVDEVISLFRKVEDKSSLLNRSRAKSVAAAVVYYYAIATKRKNIVLKDFAIRVDLSDTTIQKLAKEISAILQTKEILAY